MIPGVDLPDDWHLSTIPTDVYCKKPNPTPLDLIEAYTLGPPPPGSKVSSDQLRMRIIDPARKGIGMMRIMNRFKVNPNG